jgi:hypothetical protein
MQARVHGNERDLVRVRFVQRNHAYVVLRIPHRHTSERATVVPRQRHVIRDDHIDHAWPHGRKYRLAARGSPDLAITPLRDEADPTGMQIVCSLRPNVRREVVEAPGAKLRVPVDYMINREHNPLHSSDRSQS